MSFNLISVIHRNYLSGQVAETHKRLICPGIRDEIWALFISNKLLVNYYTYFLQKSRKR